MKDRYKERSFNLRPTVSKFMTSTKMKSQLPPTRSRGLGIPARGGAEVNTQPVFGTSDLVVHFPSFLKRGQGRLKSPLIPLY
jgi:hypothetical protein